MSDDFGLRALQAAQFLADLLGWDCEAFKPMAQRDEWWHAMKSRAQELLSGFERTDALTAANQLADGRRLDRELRERLQRAVTRLQAEAGERRRMAEARHLAPLEDQAGPAEPAPSPSTPSVATKGREADAARNRLLAFLADGAASFDLASVAAILNDAASVNEKLCRLAEAMPSRMASVKLLELAKLLQVSRQAIQKTPWWQEHRAGEQAGRAEERRGRLRDRAGEVDFG